MEHAPAGTLADRITREGPLPSDEVISIGCKLADALGAAHASDCLHRAIKLENVLIGRYGEPLLSDFGIAAVEGMTQTRTGSVTASIAHAAPEVLAGQRATARTISRARYG